MVLPQRERERSSLSLTAHGRLISGNKTALLQPKSPKKNGRRSKIGGHFISCFLLGLNR